MPGLAAVEKGLKLTTPDLNKFNEYPAPISNSNKIWWSALLHVNTLQVNPERFVNWKVIKRRYGVLLYGTLFVICTEVQ